MGQFFMLVDTELDGGLRMAQAARKYQVHSGTIRNWQRQAHKYEDRAFPVRGKTYTAYYIYTNASYIQSDRAGGTNSSADGGFLLRLVLSERHQRSALEMLTWVG